MKILGIFAHPDDEVIFGWPIFQQYHIEKHLICVTGSDSRLRCLNQLSGKCNFSWESPRIKDGEIHKNIPAFEIFVENAIENAHPDFIFTHNPHGEYQHPDHISIFNALYNMDSVKNMLITDIRISVKSKKYNIPSTNLEFSQEEIDKYYMNEFSTSSIDEDFYNLAKRIYDSENAWTWDRGPIKTCKLFLQNN